MSSRATVRSLFFGLPALIALGCGGTPEGHVAGTVTRNGIPVTTGHVNFYDPTRGTGSRGELDADGHFDMFGTVPPGEYVVFVTPLPVEPPRADAKPTRTVAKPANFDVPKKYTAAETSGLKQTIATGENVVTITLPN